MKTGTGSPPSNAAACEGEKKKKSINGELWQACAGPLVNMPTAGTHVVYFPQGHSEQVAASMKKDANAQIPNYPNLPSKLLCLLRNVTLHADLETDEVYAQMTLQPVPSFDKEALLRSDLSTKAHRPQTEFFCKTLTASDTSTHGGFSVPRRAAEKIFPPLDFTMQPPAQEIVARDLHDNVWTFRHIYRGQPKRHLLTTGWSLFIGGKRLIAGDSVLFIRDEKQQLLLGIRRANRQPTNMSSSVLSSDSMHIGILAAAAHAAANNSPFTVFYNPRASPTEFVIPLAKYYKAVCSNQISLGMRFRMMFETEESGTRRYMGTITGISDLDSVRWKNSQWRNLQVGWDESTGGERRNRVSVWEIEPVTAPFFICPTPPLFRSKLPRMPDDDTSSDLDNLFRRSKMPWLGDEFGSKDPQASLPGFSLAQWMNMQQNPSIQTNYMNPLPNSALQNLNGNINGLPSNHQISHQFNTQRPTQPIQQQFDQLPSPTYNPLALIIQPQQHQLTDINQRQNLVGQSQSQGFPASHLPPQVLQPQSVHVQNHQLQRSFTQHQHQQQHQQVTSHNQTQENCMQSQPSDQVSQHVSDSQIQLQILQKMHQHQQQQQQSFLSHQPSQTMQLQDQRKQIPDPPQNFSRPMARTQMLEPSQSTPTMHTNNPQLTRNNNFQFPQPPQQSRMLSDLPEQAGNSLNPMSNHRSNRPPSAVTDDDPSSSTSPSANNSPNAANLYSSSVGLREPISSSSSLAKDLDQKSKVSNPSPNVSKIQSHGMFASYLNNSVPHMDYLDSSSSATSVLSHNNSMSFNSQSMMFRDTNQDVDVHGGDPVSNVPFGADVDNHQLAIPMMPDPSLITKNMMGSNIDFSNEGGLLSTYENPKEVQPEPSSSMVSGSFGVPDMAFNSIDSSINDGDFMNSGAWPAPQIPRMRTYTKVYKRGAVGRSIDVTRYSGYDALKQDLARRFGIEGQLEDRQRIGWKLVYVDHENDVLLVGDDPWDEFVSCVRCIKILSPQEVQQLSLDGDFGSSVIPNQDCSSSDNGVG